jgi:glutamate N-acetyltransferase/amino-acid N-acetyltransferase
MLLFSLMKAEIEFINEGTVTSPRGFKAGSTYAGIKTYGESKQDIGILVSEVPCVAAGLFTTLRIKAAPVLVDQEKIKSGRAQAIVVNSGVANACTGEEGLKNANEMARLAAAQAGVKAADTYVASTGVIGVQLPMDKLAAGIKQIKFTADGGHNLVRAMMTTDTKPKETAVKAMLGDKEFSVGGVTKGAGMIHPNMGTMLCFVATDAALDPAFAQRALKQAVDKSFNMITVDGDTSTNDTVLLLANGLAGNKPLTIANEQGKIFQAALDTVCTTLAKKMAADGEGATKLIEINVTGAASVKEARAVARTIAGSSLVKTAVYGNDPNWGRIIAAAGRAGVAIEEQKLDLDIGGVPILKGGKAINQFRMKEASDALNKKEVVINLNINMGTEKGTAWGCDMTEGYIKENAYYTT